MLLCLLPCRCRPAHHSFICRFACTRYVFAFGLYAACLVCNGPGVPPNPQYDGEKHCLWSIVDLAFLLAKPLDARSAPPPLICIDGQVIVSVKRLLSTLRKTNLQALCECLHLINITDWKSMRTVLFKA